MRTKINLALLAGLVGAYQYCASSGKTEQQEQHKERIDKLIEPLPSGSGIDRGTRFLLEQSSADKLLFELDFHHMDAHGGYDGWTDHKLLVRPSLLFGGFILHIGGRNRNDIKDYLSDLFAEIFYVDYNERYEADL